MPDADLLAMFAAWLTDIDSEPFAYDLPSVGDIREESAR